MPRAVPTRPVAASPRAWLLLVAAAAALFSASWLLLHHGFYAHDRISDVPVYADYGRQMAHGAVPYRDVSLEYPPASLPAFVLPSLMPGGDAYTGYRRGFEALMLACGLAALALTAITLRSLGATPREAAWPLGLVAVAPLLLGSVVISHFDLWPAMLTAAALAALTTGRNRTGAAVLGLAVAAKLYPAVLVPVALAYVWKRHGRREALVCGAVLSAVLLAAFGPFLALAPQGLADSILRHAHRPLQLESLGSALLMVARSRLGDGFHVVSGYGSQNLAGPHTVLAATLQSILQITAVAGVWIASLRGEMSRERLVRLSVAAVCAFVAFGKVLSPQYMLWLVPLVILVRGRRGLVAATLLASALALTQLWFPFHYWDLADRFDAASTVLERDAVLVALFATLVAPARLFASVSVRARPGLRRHPV